MKITAIVKPTHDCNFACKYCYVESGAEQGRMSQGTLEKMTQQLCSLESRDQVHIIWHGGEPLLMGPEFYKEAVMLQEQFKGDRLVENCMQSNVSLVNEGWLDFFEQYHFNIGSSIDGPEEIHNLTRVYKDGTGTFQDVWKGLQLIRQRNTKLQKETPDGTRPKYLGGGVIVILTRKNIAQLGKIYDFLKENDLSAKINPLIKSGTAVGNYEDLSIGPKEYGQALAELFDRWFYEPEEGVDLDPLSEILGNIMTGKPMGCNFGESCRQGFISIGPQGDVYPCGRFDGIKEYWLGNICKDDLGKMIEAGKNKLIAARSAETINGCSSCEHKRLCNGGCMHNAYMVKGDVNDKDYYCASYKILFDRLGEALHKELKKAEVSEGDKDE
jgi:uncharacterized protein